jgi:ATP-dependent RNA helicase HelY
MSDRDRFLATLPWPADSFQIEAIDKLERSQGVLVSAPTSSGKTVVADYAVWRALGAQHQDAHRVIYTTPLKALSNQKYRDLCRAHGEEKIGLVTGEHTFNEDAPVVVMTTEILRNIIYEEPHRLDLVADVVLDEVHYIDDFPRGTVWEEVIIEAPQHIRFIGLSATISNVDEVAQWMTERRGEVATVVRKERPVALEMWLALGKQIHAMFEPGGAIRRRTMELAQNLEADDARMRYSRRGSDTDLFTVLTEMRQRDMLPAIYFIFSRRGCREALARCAVHNLSLTDPAERRAISQEWDAVLAGFTDPDERDVFVDSLDRETLVRGIAMHHAGMLPAAKELVEHLFQRGILKVVFATETLSLGLNMPARACVISTFTKFNGQEFTNLTSGELTQLTGRAGRRGIDTVGHGIVLKEPSVDVLDIYEAAIADEMAVTSKFAPTYTMILGLLRNRTIEMAEELVDKSFGQFQRLRADLQWDEREENLRLRRHDLQRNRYVHPRIPCTEKTLTSHLRMLNDLELAQVEMREVKAARWRLRHGRSKSRQDPGQRLDAARRRLNQVDKRINNSPCTRCPFLADHRAQRYELMEIDDLLENGQSELREMRDEYRREFRALTRVLNAAGYLEDNHPTPLGELAGSLYGESALLVADAVTHGYWNGLGPPELAATLTTLVSEDRGRERRPQVAFPTPAIERAVRQMRRAMLRLRHLENEEGIEQPRTLAFDSMSSAYQWVMGVPLVEIDTPPSADIGDVIKTMKNVYSMLRQMEHALTGKPIAALVTDTRRAMERDLIRRL